MRERPACLFWDWRYSQADSDCWASDWYRRSRDLKTARTYATREPSSLDEDRPVNPYAIPKSYGALPPLS